MADPADTSAAETDAIIGEDLKHRIAALVNALVQREPESYESEFVLFLARVQDLVDRKRQLQGTKSDTRDLLGELLFTRLRAGMRMFLQSEDQVTERRAAEWVMGALFSITTLSEFARAFDRALIKQGSTNQDFSFAGRTDFIAVEEVLQMLASGKHLGVLSLETGDNRLDIYLKDGRILFLDPHHLIRRVMPGDPMRHREIPENAVTQAEVVRAKTGRPIVLSLHEAGHIKREELREVSRLFGKEVLFEFMRERDPYAFFYRKLEALPEHVEAHDLRLGVTSILLEGSKQHDDWKQMLQVFPDPNAPIEPRADMFARMGDVALSVVEIKLLSQINGEISARGLVPVLGLPLFEVYQLLLRLAREGIVAPPGGAESLSGLQQSVEESVQMAFGLLDANDDKAERSSALDRVLGDEVATGSVLDRVLGGGSGGAAGGALSGVGAALDRMLGGAPMAPARKADEPAALPAADPTAAAAPRPGLDQEVLGLLRRSPRAPGDG